MGKRPLPYDYQYWLAGMLLSKLQSVDVEFASVLHAQTDFKHYTFSYIRTEEQRKQGNGGGNRGLEFKEGYFFLSSPDKKFVRSFSEGLLEYPEFQLNGIKMQVSRIEILPRRRFEKQVASFRMLSPLYLKTQRQEQGRLVEWDLYPTDGKFYENLHSTLTRKYQSFHGSLPANDHFYLRPIGKFKPKRHSIKGNMRRASLMSFNLEAAPELLQFGYEAGFGEKTAMGFGCAEVVEDGVVDGVKGGGGRG